MKILAINGSHRKGKNTAEMLNTVLAEAEAQGVETELVELMDYEIKECISCNKCLFKPECSIKDDDMDKLYEKMREADGIVFGSPVYFSNVTGRMKDFIDRSRPLHMVANELDGKVGGAVVHADLRNGGQELALAILNAYMQGQGMLVSSDRGADEGIVNTGAMGTKFASCEEGKMRFVKRVTQDEVALTSCQRLGRNMAKLVQRLGAE
ncbi:flavodoxin family protein [Dethiobacter alkaliphilus]|uniref:NADPH-dependent FMN reductase n=1 Tax=Dethiobacter alkaliphilus AHT 1 TaxID=555088 RepID=C0GJ27_DETAL|nr:flavodoxin family protein [Dethiobacter alkaliphilus]EEG76660.1 NADPH-dependent FMN reductase [Dethiobacter alkaliphilus AHT 1]